MAVNPDCPTCIDCIDAMSVPLIMDLTQTLMRGSAKSSVSVQFDNWGKRSAPFNNAPICSYIVNT